MSGGLLAVVIKHGKRNGSLPILNNRPAAGACLRKIKEPNETHRLIIGHYLDYIYFTKCPSFIQEGKPVMTIKAPRETLRKKWP